MIRISEIKQSLDAGKEDLFEASYVPSDEISLQINFLRYVLTDNDTHVMTVHEGMLSAAQMEMILEELGAEL